MSDKRLIRSRLDPPSVFRLALRNLTRNTKRTWITAITVAFALFLFQIFAALLIGIEQQSFDNLINYQTAHAKLYAEGYFENREEFPLDYALTDLGEFQSAIESVSGVEASTPRIVFSAQLSNGIDQLLCIGTGIQVKGSDSDVFRISEALTEGAYLKPDEEGMLIGRNLAEFLEVSTGDWVTVLTKTRDGAYEAIDLEIVGLLGTGNPLIDQSSFMVPLSTAQFMLDMEGAATELAVRFSTTARESSTIRQIREKLADTKYADLKSWQEAEEDFIALVETKRVGSGIFLFIFVVMAVVGITNTVLMAAFERTQEIGTLMAMGLRRKSIRSLFLVEGGLTGLLGGAVGSILALIVLSYFSTKGLDLTAMYGDMDIGYPVQGIVYPRSSIVLVLLSWLMTGLLAALASYYPAARASKLKPVEALRYV